MLPDFFRACLRSMTEKQAVDQRSLIAIQFVPVPLQTEPHRVCPLDLAFQFALRSHLSYQCHHLGRTDTAIPGCPDYFGGIGKNVVFNPCTVDADRVDWSQSSQGAFAHQKYEHEECKNPE